MAREDAEEQLEAIRFNRLDDLADREASREIAGQIRHGGIGASGNGHVPSNLRDTNPRTMDFPREVVAAGRESSLPLEDRIPAGR